MSCRYPSNTRQYKEKPMRLAERKTTQKYVLIKPIKIGAYVGSHFGAKEASNSLVRNLLVVVLIVAAT